MFGVEVILRYLVPGFLVVLPLLRVVPGGGMSGFTGVDAALAGVAVLVAGYAVHQLYWLLFNLFRVYESPQRRPLQVVRARLEAIGIDAPTRSRLWEEWELWTYRVADDPYRERATRLWLFVHSSAGVVLAAVLGIMGITAASALGLASFGPRFWLLYILTAVLFAALTIQNWRYVNWWEGIVADRLFSPVPKAILTDGAGPTGRLRTPVV
ncbi:MAG TPA: hypothetical protein VGR87_12535 [Candidatus Limnocylindria bacterium]|jgi:hypothetical protein|nr:hypothetical protein [Candidatus Limnocylindria bacterium]